MDVAAKRVVVPGREISCRRGCGACCRQLVPISRTEAWHLAALVDRLPDPARARVRERFDQAARTLQAAGLRETIERTESMSAAKRREVGLAYFSLGIACPFLEGESCTIHPDRPLACREYLVTSPPGNCAQPAVKGVQQVPMESRISVALARLDQTPDPGSPRWIPLVLAPEWAVRHAEPPAEKTGPEILEEVFEKLGASPVVKRERETSPPPIPID